jgi:xylulose-5-phosphate/fructose-6-phosphate phosphoketolase
MMIDRVGDAPTTRIDLVTLDRWWRAANYLSVGQIYLLANAMLTEPLTNEHVKPRLLGNWGTTPGLNFLYVHLNRVICARDLNMVFVAGPGHGLFRGREKGGRGVKRASYTGHPRSSTVSHGHSNTTVDLAT